MSDKQRALKA